MRTTLARLGHAKASKAATAPVKNNKIPPSLARRCGWMAKAKARVRARVSTQALAGALVPAGKCLSPVLSLPPRARRTHRRARPTPTAPASKWTSAPARARIRRAWRAAPISRPQARGNSRDRRPAAARGARLAAAPWALSLAAVRGPPSAALSLAALSLAAVRGPPSAALSPLARTRAAPTAAAHTRWAAALVRQTSRNLGSTLPWLPARSRAAVEKISAPSTLLRVTPAPRAQVLASTILSVLTARLAASTS
jgi:hypothetical protein